MKMLTLYQVAEELGTTEAMVTNKLVQSGKLHAPILVTGGGVNKQSLWEQKWVNDAKTVMSNRDLHSMALLAFRAA